MAKQPEGKVSTKIMKKWRERGAWVFKVHGSEYQPSGIPDIHGTYKGISVWCETKMPGNKPSMKQRYRINKIRKAGGLVVVAYSVTEALQMLDHLDAGDHTLNACECLYSRLFDLEEE